ncbi:MAG TPA: DUF4118 domain-containing protein [Candidatus Obscuribacterales bacterium]
MNQLWQKLHDNWKGYAAGVITTGLATLISHLLFPFLHSTNLIMIYLLGVVFVATRFGRGPSVLASVLSVAAFDFFFVHPYLTFVVSDTQYIVTFAVMLVVALLISTLTTQAKRQSQEAERAKFQMEAERLRSTLLSSLSHDLRTPLSTITGATESLLTAGHSLDAQAKQELTEVLFEEGQRMKRLVNNLLDMTRLEFGTPNVRKEWLPVEEVIGSALNRLEKQLSDRTVTLDLPNELALVPMDGVLIEQVFLNLLENAIKYTPPGSPIEISAHIGTAQVTFTIADSGPGITPGEERKVFEKFHRGKQDKQREGMGLGLTICREIIKAHGGEISVTNRPQGGALFKFVLPLEGIPPEVLKETLDREVANPPT